MTLDRIDAVFQEQGSGSVELQCPEQRVALKACTPQIVNMRLLPLPDLGQSGKIVVGEKKWHEIHCTFGQGDPFKIATEALAINLYRDPFTVEYLDRQGKILLKGKEPFIDADEAAREDDLSSVVVQFETAPNEHFYGLGDGGSRFEKRNIDQRIWTDHINREGSEITIPLVISTRGYGIFFHSPFEASISIHDETGLTYRAAGGLLDFYFLYGPSIDNVLKNYYELTGFPPLLPQWAFGYQQSSRHFINTQEVMDLARNLRERKIPCDHLTFLSSYSRISDREDGWDNPVAHLDFNSRLWSEPQKMVDELRSQNFHIMFHQYPQIGKDSPDYEEFKERGYGITQSDGSPLNFRPDDAWYTQYVDFTNPDARQWWWQKMRRFLEMGVDSWWHDGGEGPEAGELYDGSYRKCHNTLDLFRQRLWYEKQREAFPERRVATRCRTTFAGAHRYGIMLQPGDMMSGIDYLKVQVMRTLSSALSGFPFRGPDMGGHYPDVTADFVLTGKHMFDGTVSQEVYLRWVQFCAFNSIMWSHGQFWRSKLPWMRGPEVEAVIRKYIELRYRLLPYIYSSVWKTCTTGAPFIRALVLDYPDDANATDLSTQYMLGKFLLVAPVLEEGFGDGSKKWPVYLPEGTWYDFWSNTEHSGGRWIKVEADLETLPVFIKGGSIIPMAPLMQYVTEKPLDPITLLVYPLGSSAFDLYEDDGETYGYETGEFALTAYQCDIDSTGAITVTLGKPEGSFNGQTKSRDYVLKIHSRKRPHMISVNGDPLPAEEAKTGRAKTGRNVPGSWSLQKRGMLAIMISGVADKTVVTIS